MNAALDDSQKHIDPITDAEFSAISRIVYTNFGIVLGEEKRSLVVGRLHSCLGRRGLTNFGEYLRLLKRDESGEIHSELVNQISTNFTSFFREPAHFDFLANTVLPEWTAKLNKRGSNDLRIWCAACASGEEAYTLQMVIMRKLGLDYGSYDGGLLATDISAKALLVAKTAVYSAEQIGPISPGMRHAYFKSLGNNQFIVRDNIREQILFKRFNLMNERFPFGKKFQIIFARNVMIYFDEDTRQRLIRKLYNQLESGGYLFIGHSETINPEWTDLKNILPATYLKSS